MDKKQAQQLIKETFEGSFDKNRFTGLIKNLLKFIEEDSFSYKGNFIPDAFKQHISSLDRIGKYSDGEHKIDILVVKLKKESSIERARTMQRNFIAWYLNGSRGGNMKDAALAAFVSPDEEDWRFSLVKMDYRFEEGKKGKIKVKEEFTLARRWSFLVGAHENSHTAQSRLVNILINDENKPTLKELEESFNIETVTKEFFEKYRELFLWVKDTLEEVIKNDKKIKADFEKKGVNRVEFAKKLLGQIVFLYFLQKKGWFGVKRNADWGTGPKNFLRELFEGKHGKYQNFFNDILEPLFYEALATEREADYYSRFDCKIPFLNGGLFDPINNYDWVHTDITLPNELFSNNYRTKEGDKGSGVLDVFDRYNFTVEEDEPLEKEVAIDPELLGKAYEKFNAIRPDNYEEYRKALKSGQKGAENKFNKQYGVYYTPRDIVQYMCQQSLINYLATELEGKVNKEDIGILVKYGERIGENEALVEAKGKETKTYSYKLSESIRQNARQIDEKLTGIKVCDPAIGSGAFPVGMMGEIVKARNTLTAFIKEDGRTIYNFKRGCIEKSLYGVDIDPGAVEIAKLRLWLSLVVDEDDIKNIKSLPNLDYKIMQGNSLLEEYEGIKLFDESFLFPTVNNIENQMAELMEEQSKLRREWINLHNENKLTSKKKSEINAELQRITEQFRKSNLDPSEVRALFGDKNRADELFRLHSEFFRTSQKSVKDELKNKIEKLEWDLIESTLKGQGKESEARKLEEFKKANTRPFFLWKLHFAEVFKEKGGFDVVIANPPYLSHDKIQEKKILAQKFRAYEPFADLYCYFLETALNLQNEKGLLCYITSNSYLKTEYGRPLRGLLLEKDNILSIVNIEDFQVFDAAIVNTALLIAQRHYKTETPKCLVVNVGYDGEVPFEAFIEKNKFFCSPDDFRGRSWFLLSPQQFSLKRKIELGGKTLEMYGTKIRLGIATGANEVFVIDGMQKNELIKKDSRSARIIKPVLRGRDIFRYKYQFNNKYIILVANGINVREEYPEIYSYLNSFGDVFKKRGAKGEHWSNLRPTAFLDDFKKEKIVWIELTDKGRFALCSEEVYLLNSAYFLIPPKQFNTKYLLALLNSRLIEFYLGLIAETSGMGVTRWINNYVKDFPIKEISGAVQKPFIELVDKIIVVTKGADYLENPTKQTQVREYEKQIDQMVYKLYGLTGEEIKVVES